MELRTVTRRATIAIDFDVDSSTAAEWADYLRRSLGDHLRNVEVTVLDDGAPTLPAATATGPAKGAKA